METKTLLEQWNALVAAEEAVKGNRPGAAPHYYAVASELIGRKLTGCEAPELVSHYARQAYREKAARLARKTD